jgi:protein phosphatase
MNLLVEVAGKTDVGCVRANNEDNFGYDSRHGIYVVCDGMGGQAAGEVASKMGVDIVLSYFREGALSGMYPQVGSPLEGISEGGQALAGAIRLANRTIHETGQHQVGRAGMGSTMVAVLIRDSQLSIGNVGDSRIYMVRQGAIQQLTQDHSLVMEQVRRGYITLEQAARSEMQNIILRALGSDEAVEADVEDLVLLAGDILVMSSDGLTKYVEDQEILEIAGSHSSLEQICEALVRLARGRGGDDNITCLVMKAKNPPWYRRILGKRFARGGKWQNSI